MLYSESLLSRKGPSGVIWAAVYSYKKLKKAQVAETDISAFIDEILLDNFPEVACRVLGYLLLGVVRIYSKKVEYLFNDCHKVVVKINDFAGAIKFNANTRDGFAPFLSITMPARFELDAFDLEILEDISGDHVGSREEILLQDTWKNERTVQHSLDYYLREEEAAVTCVAAYTPVEYFLSSMGASSSHNLSDLETNMEKLLDQRISQEKPVDCEMVCAVEEEPANLVRPFDEERHTDGGHIQFPHVGFSENGNCQLILENQMNVLFPGVGDNHVVGSPSHNLSNMVTNMEKLRDCSFSQQDCLNHEMFCKGDKEHPDYHGVFGEELHANDNQTKNSELASPENRKHHVITEKRTMSITTDATPEPMFPDVSGATSPRFMIVPTPTNKESARIPRKRKCLFDQIVVLPNNVLKQSIHDSSDLVCKRRKVPHTALDAWKACRIPYLSWGFLESLFPWSSLDVMSLFCSKILKAPESATSIEGPDHLSALVVPTVITPTKLTPLTPVTPTEHYTLARVDALRSLSIGRSSDQTAIAPETPVDQSTPRRLHEGLRDPDRWISMSSSESEERELSPIKDEDFDLNLMNEAYFEEGDSSEGRYGELYGWSVRTRAVAEFFSKRFLNPGKLRDGKVVSLLQVLEGRTEKESARLFYEILVLKTAGCVDVMQDNAHDDILVLELPRLNQLCRTHGL